MIRGRPKRRQRRPRQRRWGYGGKRPGAGRLPHDAGKLVRKTYTIEEWHVIWLNWYAAQHRCRTTSEAFRHLIDAEGQRQREEYLSISGANNC